MPWLSNRRYSHPVLTALVVLLLASCSGSGNADIQTTGTAPSDDSTAADSYSTNQPKCSHDLLALSKQLDRAMDMWEGSPLVPSEDLSASQLTNEYLAVVTLREGVRLSEFDESAESDAVAVTLLYQSAESSPFVEAVVFDKSEGLRTHLSDSVPKEVTSEAMVVGFTLPFEAAMRHEDRLGSVAYDIVVWPAPTLLSRWDVSGKTSETSSHDKDCPPYSSWDFSTSELSNLDLIDQMRVVKWFSDSRGGQLQISKIIDEWNARVMLKDPIRLTDFDNAKEPTAIAAVVHLPGNEYHGNIEADVPLTMSPNEIAAHLERSIALVSATTTTLSYSSTAPEQQGVDSSQNIDTADIESRAQIIAVVVPMKPALNDESRLRSIAQEITIEGSP